jgi:dihydroflavonol-4-reductase
MSRYLVTGATGFLGSHLAQQLAAMGAEVVPYSRTGPLGGDVRDARRVQEAARGCDGAFHCAGRVSRREEDAEELYRVHVEGTKSVLEACREAGVRRVVVASTSGTVAVSDSPDRVATENDAAPLSIVGRWPYYRAKLFAERAALEHNSADLEVVSVNPSLLLGAGDERGSSNEDVRLFLERRIPAVPAGGISFVDARDAARAMWLAMERARAGERYLVGACNLTLREFFSRLTRISGVPGPFVSMPRAPRVARWAGRAASRVAAGAGLAAFALPIALEMAQYFWYLDSGKAERELGWRAAHDPTATLYDTVQDLRARGAVWPRETRSA